MKWYVSDLKEQKSGECRVMAIAGPFDTREQADAWHTEHISEVRCGTLSQGIDDLGPDWKKNIELWKAGELK